MKTLLLVVALLFSGTASAILIQFETSNTVLTPDFSTTFASFPSNTLVNSPQSLDGFTFNQVNGDPYNIWTAYNPGGTGSGRGWYPNGGDSGYTEITLANGSDFNNLSMFIGSGFSDAYLAYEFMNNNVSLMTGVLSGHQSNFQWLSITGGGFDTIRLRDGSSSSISVGDSSLNALAFDSVYATVVEIPEPSSIALFLITLMGLRILKGKEPIRGFR